MNQALDYHHIAPDAIELAMLFINADLSKAHRLNQAPAGLIFHENARQQLPESGLVRRLDQRR